MKTKTKQELKATAAELRERADSLPSGLQLNALREDFEGYWKQAEATISFLESGDLKADEQRDVDAIFREMAAVQLKVTTAREHELKGVENRHRKFGSPGAAPSQSNRGVGHLPSLLEYRAMSIDNQLLGGFLVSPQHSTQFYDRLRPESIMLSAGCQVVDMLSDSYVLPRLGSSTTVRNAGEAGTITASDATINPVLLTARTYAVRTIGSAEWFSDANPSARNIVADDHVKQIAAAVDNDALEGDGLAKLLGIRNHPGLTPTYLGSADGAVITIADILSAITRLETANAKPSAVLMHPRTWGTLRAEKDLTTGRYQLQPDPSSEARRSIFGLPVFLSSQISIADTRGSNSDTSWVAVADMSQIVLGRRLDVAVLFDPYSNSSTNQIVVQTTARWAGAGIINTAAVDLIAGVRA